MVSETELRSSRALRISSASTDVTKYQGDSAFFDAGSDLGAFNLEPKLRPFKNEDGYTHIEYELSSTGEPLKSELGEPIVKNALYEITVLNRETGQRQAIPFSSAKKRMKLVDHNRLVPIVDAWVGQGAKPLLVTLSKDKAVFSGILELPDLFTKFSGMDELVGKLIVQNSINGTKRFGVRFGTERYICRNMFHFEDKNGSTSFSTKHTKLVELRIAERIEVQHDAIRANALEMETSFERLSNSNMDNSQTVDFLRGFLVSSNKKTKKDTTYSDLESVAKTKVDNRIEEIVEIANGSGNQGNSIGSIGGTAYGVYNAIIEQTDWYRDGSQFTREGIPNRNYANRVETRTMQALGVDDSTVAFKVNALEAITDYVAERELSVL